MISDIVGACCLDFEYFWYVLPLSLILLVLAAVILGALEHVALMFLYFGHVFACV